MEQGRDRVQLKLNKYFQNAGDILVDVFSLRDLPTSEILPLIEGYIVTEKPKLVLIDIGSDLVNGGINDLHESSFVVNLLSRLAEKYNLAIVVSLHLSRSKNEASGHFGSVLLKRSEVILSVKAYEDYFLVKPLYCRDLPPEPWAFQIRDGMAVPIETTIPSDEISDKPEVKRKGDFGSVPTATHVRILETIFQGKTGLRPKEFKAALHQEYSSSLGTIGLLLVRELQRYYVNTGLLEKRGALLHLVTNPAPTSL